MQHNRLLGRANAAQQCDDVAFFHIDGTFEGGVAVPAEKRVSRRHKRRSEGERRYIALVFRSRVGFR